MDKKMEKVNGAIKTVTKNKFVEEFKEFISRGNVIDMAVGIIIGGAFTSIVNSLVNDITMPVITLITGGTDFSSMNITLAGEGETAVVLSLGNFLAAIINFLLIALVVFLFVKGVSAVRRKKAEEPAPATTKVCPFCKETISLEAKRCPHCTSELE